MATTKDYKEFVVEKCGVLPNILCRPMMGEYLLYYDDILFGGIYDNRLLIKKTESNQKYNLQEEIPYQGAKSMYYIEEIENQELLREIILETCKDLPRKKKKEK